MDQTFTIELNDIQKSVLIVALDNLIYSCETPLEDLPEEDIEYLQFLIINSKDLMSTLNGLDSGNQPIKRPNWT